MKFLVAAVAFVATIGLTTQTLANEKEENIPQKMNSLYPTKQANLAMAVRPAIVELKSPAFLSTVGAGSVKLEWTASSGSEQYHLQVATDPNFKWLVGYKLPDINNPFKRESFVVRNNITYFF